MLARRILGNIRLQLIGMTLSLLAPTLVHSQSNQVNPLTLLAEAPVPSSPTVLAQFNPVDDPPEQWSIHAQSTYIIGQKNNFNSPYYGQNSLLNKSEGSGNDSFTWSATAFLGGRLWEGGEFYYNPEMFEGTPFGGSLVGLGAFQNGELQKGSYIPPTYYSARAFIRQIIGLGGEREHIEDGPNQLAGPVDSNRLVVSYGKFASLDFFDQNKYSHDPRTQFQNFALFSMAAYGYAADAKGFTYGVVGEWYQGNWTLRAARLAVPTTPNTMELNYSLTQDYTNQVELTHQHELWGQPGAVRGLFFQQRAFMASYQDAISQGYQLGLTPNILTARFGEQNMWGYGLNIEQAVNEDMGLFARWSWNNGQTETQTLDVSSSLSFGTTLKGSNWSRPNDTIGLGYAINGISASEISYLQQGGYTMFIGDGALSYKREQVIETYYSAQVYKNLYISADYQHITNPAYNSARGPVNFYGLRAHIEI